MGGGGESSNFGGEEKREHNVIRKLLILFIFNKLIIRFALPIENYKEMSLNHLRFR